MDSLKRFVGVYFTSIQWEVVPRNWLYDQDGDIYCYWPTEKNKNISQLVQDQVSPNPETWGSDRVKTVEETSGALFCLD
jgi:hypothetical protein